MLSGPTAFPTIGGHLVDAVRSRLQAAGTWPRDARAAVVPAPIVWDDCHCGLLAVAVERVRGSVDGRTGAAENPTGLPPTPAIPWPPYLLGDFQVAMLRCATTDAVPPAETLTSEALVVHADAHEVMVAVACELDRLRTAGEVEDYVLGEQPFLPAQGGCQGAQLACSVSVPFRCPCS